MKLIVSLSGVQSRPRCHLSHDPGCSDLNTIDYGSIHPRPSFLSPHPSRKPTLPVDPPFNSYQLASTFFHLTPPQALRQLSLERRGLQRDIRRLEKRRDECVDGMKGLKIEL
jgi:hypothetical protein